MSKINPSLLSIVVLLIAPLACALPGIATPDSNAIGTLVVQTIVAELTQTAQPVIPITGLESQTPTFTQTHRPTPTLSPTPLFTSTPLTPLISVSVPTNCRVGPGKVYDRVGALLVGEVAEVVGRDPTGNYWYIRNPDQTNGFCWLWGEYAVLTGNFLALPIFTPPPTPTFTPTPLPKFRASYSGKDTCVGWWVEIELKNTGETRFRSISLTIKDTVTNISLSLDANGFTDVDGCTTSTTRDNLNPGATRIFSAPAFVYDPTGHKLRATITLCTENGLKGTCIEEVIEFTP